MEALCCSSVASSLRLCSSKAFWLNRSRHFLCHPVLCECWFCRLTSTYYINANVRRCAVEVEDTALLVKLAAGDMIAIDAMYITTACVHCTTGLDRLR